MWVPAGNVYAASGLALFAAWMHAASAPRSRRWSLATAEQPGRTQKR